MVFFDTHPSADFVWIACAVELALGMFDESLRGTSIPIACHSGAPETVVKESLAVPG